MKRANSASIFASGNGISAKRAVLFLLTGMLCLAAEGALSLQKYRIDKIHFKNSQNQPLERSRSEKFLLLLELQPGEEFSYKKNRSCLEILYRTGLFSDIGAEAAITDKKNKRLELTYVLSPRFRIARLTINSGEVNAAELQKAMVSLRPQTLLSDAVLERGIQEIREFMNSRGYFNPTIARQVQEKPERGEAELIFSIKPGIQTRIRTLEVTGPQPEILKKINAGSAFNMQFYAPFLLQKGMEQLRRLLKKESYYFPEIKSEEAFFGADKTEADVRIRVETGSRYRFIFTGDKNYMSLIASIWDKKVYEQWAEQESRAKILYDLKEKGYLNAVVNSEMVWDETNNTRTFTFKVEKNRKYKLDKIYFRGNREFSEKELRGLIKSDTGLYDRLFGVRSSALRIDQEVLRLFYYFKGFPSCLVDMEPKFRRDRVDIWFNIDEGRKYTVESLLIGGNRHFKTPELLKAVKTINGGPFVQQVINGDIDELKRRYYLDGYDDIAITPEISSGVEKSILLKINEGVAFRMGNLAVIGASHAQEGLLRALFPLKKGDIFNRIKIDAFITDMDNSAIFTELKLLRLPRPDGAVNVLIQAAPDRSIYYGFGAGWEQGEEKREQKGLFRTLAAGLRGTLEYQSRNVFSQYSTFSGLLQIGPSERRLTVAYDTPFFLKKRLSSELKLWVDSETFPSYEFERFGISEALVKRTGLNSYYLFSLSLYRTWLTQLAIAPNKIDYLNHYFDTAAIRFSYVMEKRDDPFNPTRGSYFSSDVKIGLPIINQHFSFIKLRWSYQYNMPLLQNGILSLSLRNGLATGDMSITERFFAGGVNSFRGARTDGLGPTAPASLANAGEKMNPMGGNALLLLNAEAIFPIPLIPGDSFFYSIFADVGNVFREVKDIDFSNLEYAVGFGLRFKTQLGPVRLDFAWNLNRLNANYFRVHLGIGNVF